MNKKSNTKNNTPTSILSGDRKKSTMIKSINKFTN